MSAAHHIEWLSLVEKTGPFLSVSVLDEAMPAGLDALPTFNRKRIRSAYEEWCDAVDEADPRLKDFHREWIRLVIEEFLEYDASVLKSGEDISDSLSYQHPQTSDSIHPDFAVLSDEKAKLLIATYPSDTDLESPLDGEPWAASPLERMTLMCRAKEVPIGLVTNGERWTLVGALADGTTSYGSWFSRIWLQEPITLQAFKTLLGVRRCFGPERETLKTLFTESLKHRDEVTDTLGEQVRRAIEVLVQALDRSDLDRDRQLLKDVPPKILYEAGLTVMMRFVFLLCAEERKLLLLGEPTYDQYYAVSTLRSQLLADAEHHGLEVLERRHDAWSRVLSVFRAVFAGIAHEDLRLPALGGSIFDPDKYPFLEGRALGTTWEETPAVPLPIDNRTVLMLLSALQVLEQNSGAQYLSYETLDVEQIGHVYEGLLERTAQRVREATVGLIGSAKSVNPNLTLRELEQAAENGQEALIALIAEKSGRSKSAVRNAVEKETPQKLRDRLLSACAGDTALSERVRPFTNHLRTDNWGDPLIYRENAFNVTIGAGRRETGTHYTPKSFTEPIVQRTLEPLVYNGLLEGAERSEWELKTPAEILALKVCDMAMGSGAFLVQTCRWLGDRLVEAWQREEAKGSAISTDGVVIDKTNDSELLTRESWERALIARRLVASRCIYGVDINQMAVELAKLSIWLETLRKGHPFSFLDHKLKCGDSLVGLSKSQIQGFHWIEQEQSSGLLFTSVDQSLVNAGERRNAISNKSDFDYLGKQHEYQKSEEVLTDAKIVGDLVIAAFFGGDQTKPRDHKSRLERRNELARITSGLHAADRRRFLIERDISGAASSAFHWELEFPEVFETGSYGFDCFIGNPPFGGKNTLLASSPRSYVEWLKAIHPGSHGNSDVVAHFFRRSFELLRPGGTIGLIATNTISQGDTKTTGLEWICTHGGTIYEASRRVAWPGTAAVIVSIAHIFRGNSWGKALLDNKECKAITAYLFHEGTHTPPKPLIANRRRSSVGSYVLGAGFLFDDKGIDKGSFSLAKRAAILEKNPENARFIKPYLGGADLNESPVQEPHRYCIDFGEMPQYEAQLWPDLFELLEVSVKPVRAKVSQRDRRELWWMHATRAKDAAQYLIDHERCLAVSQLSQHAAFAFVPKGSVFALTLVLILEDSFAAFAIVQSNLHHEWARFFGSTLGDGLRYTPSDCFETFPFPENWETNKALEDAGRKYYERRAKLMIEKNEGLTKIYNRFHDPSEHDPGIAELRDLHVLMNNTVLEAYGWSEEIPINFGFHATHEVDEGKSIPWRYTWPDDIHDRNLASMLELNHLRFCEEGSAARLRNGKVGLRKQSQRRSPTKNLDQPTLL